MIAFNWQHNLNLAGGLDYYVSSLLLYLWFIQTKNLEFISAFTQLNLLTKNNSQLTNVHKLTSNIETTPGCFLNVSSFWCSLLLPADFITIFNSNSTCQWSKRFVTYFPVNSFFLSLVLVTGGSGFIGYHSSIRLSEKGHKVIVLDEFNNEDPHSKRIASLLNAKGEIFISL